MTPSSLSMNEQNDENHHSQEKETLPLHVLPCSTQPSDEILSSASSISSSPSISVANDPERNNTVKEPLPFKGKTLSAVSSIFPCDFKKLQNAVNWKSEVQHSSEVEPSICSTVSSALSVSSSSTRRRFTTGSLPLLVPGGVKNDLSPRTLCPPVELVMKSTQQSCKSSPGVNSPKSDSSSSLPSSGKPSPDYFSSFTATHSMNLDTMRHHLVTDVSRIRKNSALLTNPVLEDEETEEASRSPTVSDGSTTAPTSSSFVVQSPRGHTACSAPEGTRSIAGPSCAPPPLPAVCTTPTSTDVAEVSGNPAVSSPTPTGASARPSSAVVCAPLSRYVDSLVHKSSTDVGCNEVTENKKDETVVFSAPRPPVGLSSLFSLAQGDNVLPHVVPSSSRMSNTSPEPMDTEVKDNNSKEGSNRKATQEKEEGKEDEEEDSFEKKRRRDKDEKHNRRAKDKLEGGGKKGEEGEDDEKGITPKKVSISTALFSSHSKEKASFPPSPLISNAPLLPLYGGTVASSDTSVEESEEKDEVPGRKSGRKQNQALRVFINSAPAPSSLHLRLNHTHCTPEMGGGSSAGFVSSRNSFENDNEYDFDQRVASHDTNMSARCSSNGGSSDWRVTVSASAICRRRKKGEKKICAGEGVEGVEGSLSLYPFPATIPPPHGTIMDALQTRVVKAASTLGRKNHLFAQKIEEKRERGGEDGGGGKCWTRGDSATLTRVVTHSNMVLACSTTSFPLPPFRETRTVTRGKVGRISPVPLHFLTPAGVCIPSRRAFVWEGGEMKSVDVDDEDEGFKWKNINKRERRMNRSGVITCSRESPEDSSGSPHWSNTSSSSNSRSPTEKGEQRYWRRIFQEGGSQEEKIPSSSTITSLSYFSPLPSLSSEREGGGLERRIKNGELWNGNEEEKKKTKRRRNKEKNKGGTWRRRKRNERCATEFSTESTTSESSLAMLTEDSFSSTGMGEGEKPYTVLHWREEQVLSPSSSVTEDSIGSVKDEGGTAGTFKRKSSFLQNGKGEEEGKEEVGESKKSITGEEEKENKGKNGAEDEEKKKGKVSCDPFSFTSPIFCCSSSSWLDNVPFTCSSAQQRGVKGNKSRKRNNNQDSSAPTRSTSPFSHHSSNDEEKNHPSDGGGRDSAYSHHPPRSSPRSKEDIDRGKGTSVWGVVQKYVFFGWLKSSSCSCCSCSTSVFHCSPPFRKTAHPELQKEREELYEHSTRNQHVPLVPFTTRLTSRCRPFP